MARDDTSPGPGAIGAAIETARTIRNHLLLVLGAAIGLAAGTVVLGACTLLSGAIIAAGSLVVESNVKRVQHRMGGIVEEVLVRDGQRVDEGELLIRLDATIARANLATVDKSLWELAARRARLEAERDGDDQVTFSAEAIPAAAAADGERIVLGERRLFQYRREALLGQKAQLAERIAQLLNEIAGLEEQRTAKTAEAELIRKELVGVTELWQKNLVPLARLTALEREAARLSGERGLLQATIAQTRGKVAETELQILQLGQNLRSDVAKELADIRAKLAELAERRTTALDELGRIDIRAPQAGFVHQLAAHTRGGVVAPGEQIMLIVPGSDALVVETRIAPQDIAQVADGQAVTLRFPSFNQRTTPELNGTITRIAPDIAADQRTGASYFTVRIAIAPGEAQRLESSRLVPGMPVDAFIRTRERSVLSYMLKPLVEQSLQAFRER